ncbi:MAG TPA: Amuc_1100 family pilus-like protein [Chthoniobacterales bacterium]|nr:Amuc_1100 family pilus-like protein [Chthoniobacterales bacterium]
MKWFQQNRWLGSFLIAFGLATLVALYFLFSSKWSWDAAAARYKGNATELSRLQRLAPFPSGENVRKMKAHAADYATNLTHAKEEMKARMLPVTPLAPNEFQARLRQAVTAAVDKARANKVKLPDNFFLGFNEFASGLPSTELAPLLAQQLEQAEVVLNFVLDARVNALNAFHRTPLAEERGTTSTPPSTLTGARKGAAANAASPKLIQCNVIAMTFTSSPAAARKILSQLANSKQQFYIVRTLRILNEKDKGPTREVAADVTASTVPDVSAKPAANAGLKFIVGNEHLQTSATVEMLRFNF